MEKTKLTLEETIAALECCYSDDDVCLCAQCPLLHIGLHDCKELLGRNALNLLYRVSDEHLVEVE